MATNKVKETVETIKNEAVDTAKKISKAAEPAVEAAKNTIKTVEEIAEPAVKKAKSTAKKTAKAAESAAKTAGKKIAAAIVPEVYVEYAGKQVDCAQLVERCKADFKSKHKSTAIRSCKLYIKPEDAMVYYVINNKEDKIEL